MTAFDVVRFRVKPGEGQRFIDYHRVLKPDLKGFVGGSIIKTGEQTYCFLAEWRNFQSIVNARPQMIAMLDGIRDALEDLGNGLGVTDPVSGEVVLRFAPAIRRKKPARKKAAKAVTKKRQVAKKKPGRER